MRNSIELRVPYVDIDLYCNQIMNYKYKRSGNGKQFLKNYIFKKIPKNLINRTKVGFNPPLDSMIDKIGNLDLKIFLIMEKSLIT